MIIYNLVNTPFYKRYQKELKLQPRLPYSQVEQYQIKLMGLSRSPSGELVKRHTSEYSMNDNKIILELFTAIYLRIDNP